MLNLTQHNATLDQARAGVVEPQDKTRVQQLLTFECMPSQQDMADRASALAEIAEKAGATQVLIGGAPWFMSTLEFALVGRGISPFYAFSKRRVIEAAHGNEVHKLTVFDHIGFIPAA